MLIHCAQAVVIILHNYCWGTLCTMKYCKNEAETGGGFMKIKIYSRQVHSNNFPLHVSYL